MSVIESIWIDGTLASGFSHRQTQVFPVVPRDLPKDPDDAVAVTLGYIHEIEVKLDQEAEVALSGDNSKNSDHGLWLQVPFGVFPLLTSEPFVAKSEFDNRYQGDSPEARRQYVAYLQNAFFNTDIRVAHLKREFGSIEFKCGKEGTPVNPPQVTFFASGAGEAPRQYRFWLLVSPSFCASYIEQRNTGRTIFKLYHQKPRRPLAHLLQRPDEQVAAKIEFKVATIVPYAQRDESDSTYCCDIGNFTIATSVQFSTRHTAESRARVFPSGVAVFKVLDDSVCFETWPVLDILPRDQTPPEVGLKDSARASWSGEHPPRLNYYWGSDGIDVNDARFNDLYASVCARLVALDILERARSNSGELLRATKLVLAEPNNTPLHLHDKLTDVVGTSLVKTFQFDYIGTVPEAYAAANRILQWKMEARQTTGGCDIARTCGTTDDPDLLADTICLQTTELGNNANTRSIALVDIGYKTTDILVFTVPLRTEPPQNIGPRVLFDGSTKAFNGETLQSTFDEIYTGSFALPAELKEHAKLALSTMSRYSKDLEELTRKVEVSEWMSHRGSTGLPVATRADVDKYLFPTFNASFQDKVFSKSLLKEIGKAGRDEDILDSLYQDIVGICFFQCDKVFDWAAQKSVFGNRSGEVSLDESEERAKAVWNAKPLFELLERIVEWLISGNESPPSLFILTGQSATIRTVREKLQAEETNIPKIVEIYGMKKFLQGRIKWLGSARAGKRVVAEGLASKLLSPPNTQPVYFAGPSNGRNPDGVYQPSWKKMDSLGFPLYSAHVPDCTAIFVYQAMHEIKNARLWHHMGPFHRTVGSGNWVFNALTGKMEK